MIKIIRLLLAVMILGLFSGNLGVHADSETVITNNVSVNVSTGGNSGSVTQGTSEADVFIETTVDGETINFVDEHIVSGSGETIEVKADVVYEDGESSVSTQINTTTENVAAEEEEVSVVIIPTEATRTGEGIEGGKLFEEESILQEEGQEESNIATALSNLEEKQTKDAEETEVGSTTSALPIAYGLFSLAAIGFIAYAIKLFI